MTNGSKRYLAGLFAIVALLALAFVKWSPEETAAPSNSISDEFHWEAERAENAEALRQPTILNAETAPSPNSVLVPVTLSPRADVSPRVSDAQSPSSPTPLAPPQADFLSVPPLEPLQRR